MAFNLWLEHIIDGWIRARAAGTDWRDEVAKAERGHTGPIRVLTREDLAAIKGITFSRQYLHDRVRRGTFPKPFKSSPIKKSE